MTISEVTYNVFWISLYLAILLLFFGAISLCILSWFRKRSEKFHEYDVTFLQIKLPPDNELEVKVAEHLFSGLVGFRKSFWQSLFTGQYRVSFEIVSKINGIGFYVVVPNDIVSLVEKQINGVYPTAEIDIVDPNEIWDRGVYTSIAELKLSGPSYFPIQSYEDLKSDTLSLITSSMSKVKEQEVLAVQYVISPSSDTWRIAGQSFLSGLRAKANNPDKKINIDNTFLEGIEKKITKPGFDVNVRIVSISENKLTSETHIRNIVTTFEQFTNVRYSRFKRKKFIASRKLVDDFIYRKLNTFEIFVPFFDIEVHRDASVLNTAELATVFHFPNKDVQTPNILWLEARKSPAPTNIPLEGLYLGKSVFRSVETKVFIRPEDRTRHMYIIGQTGTGKSEFMKSLAIQDIKNGEGLAFIDPHGSDIDDILLKIPKERMEDVILFDAADTERPMGINILEADSEEQKHMIINAFIALLYKLYDPNRQGIMGPQLERTIRNVMLTAMVDKESTMVDILRMLIDPKYVQTFIPKITDPLVKRYWTDEMAKTTDFHKSEKLGYIVSKFDRFVTEKTMRNIVGQPKSSFNFSAIMAEKKILLVDLSKGKIGEENSNFLGLLLIPRILAAAMGRASLLGKEEFPDFYLYVDEFQNFATPDFATILAEARKYKLNLTMANQFIAQLDDDIKNAVFGNVGTLATFRVGADDSEYLKTQFEPTFTQKDLINLPIGNAYMRLLVKGQPTPPFSMAVDWDAISSTPKNPEIAENIRNMSRLKYNTPVNEVEEYINMRIGFNEPEEKVPPSLMKDKFPF